MGFMISPLGSVGSTGANSSFTTAFGGAAGTSPLLTPAATAAGATSLGSNTASSIQSATNIGFSTPVNVPLPSWLTTNPDDLQKELKDQYGTVGDEITNAANKAGRKAGKAADMAYGQQMREGQNATSQMTAVDRQQGGTAATSSIVAGQMAEDAGKNKVDARVAIANMKLGATEQAASLSSQIAGQMASLRTSYLGMLAGTSTANRGQDISQTDFAQSQAQQAQEFAANLQASKGGSGSSSGSGGGAGYYGAPGAGVGTYLGPMTPFGG